MIYIHDQSHFTGQVNFSQAFRKFSKTRVSPVQIKYGMKQKIITEMTGAISVNLHYITFVYYNSIPAKTNGE